MIIAPQSTVTLYRDIPIRNGINIVFRNSTEQSTYFNKHVLQSNAPCTVIRKTNTLKIEIPCVLNIRNMNYLSFVNPSFDDRVFYATIINYDYVNNNCVEVIYAIDYWQAYMFDITAHDCLINREHLSENDYQKSLTNPYDPSILEFQTGESLPVGYMLEDNIINDDDMVLMYEDWYNAIKTESASSSEPSCYTLMYISSIDFNSLDVVSEWNDMMANVKETGGFYLRPGEYNLSTSNADSKWLNAGSGDNTLITTQRNMTWIICLKYQYSSVSTTTTVSSIINKLTEWGVVSSLVNMYFVPKAIIRAAFNEYVPYSSQGASPFSFPFAPLKSSYDSQKLSCFPYSYMRLMSSAGDVEELHYEYFKELVNGEERSKLGITSIINDFPTAIIAPFAYKYPYSISESVDFSQYNMQFAMMLNQFPSVAYTTDAYLAASAAIAQQNIKANTWIAQQERNLQYTTSEAEKRMGVINAISGQTMSNASNITFNANGNVGLDPTAAAQTGLNFLNAGAHTNLKDRATKIIQSNDQFINASYDALTGGESANVFATNLAPTKPAYASNHYTPSDGTGRINYIEGGFFDIVFHRVSLRDEIQKSYDSYFRNYGYSSGRCGQPRIFNYIKNTGDMPHFTYTDEDPNGIKSTYIQTTHLHTTSSIADVDSFISALFDGGVRMLQGSDLIAKENS